MAADISAAAAAQKDAAPLHPLVEFWRYFRANRGALAGLIVIAVLVVLAVGADVIAPHPFAEQYRDSFLRPPVWADGGSWRFVLGTDDVGRDILSRLIHGARVSMMIGAIVILISLAAGVVL